MKRLIGILLIALGILTPLSLALTPVDRVEPQAYQGVWHEIALIPYFFEKSCRRNALVRYTLLPAESENQPVFEDYFQCTTENGSLKSFTGRAKVVSPSSNSILSATFLKIFGWRYWFGKNYWIIGLDPQYQYAVVGQPNMDHGWVFSREPELNETQWQSVISILKNAGFDTCRFTTMPQDGGLAIRQKLCEIKIPAKF